MSESAFDRIRGIAADVLGVKPETLSPSSSPESVENWDSVQHLNLVLAIEQQFGLEFAPEDIDQMKNLGSIASIAERKQNGAGA